MFEKTISKDADSLLKLLYGIYLKRTKNGMSKSSAKLFGNSKDVQKNYFPNESIEDIDDLLIELQSNDFIQAKNYDNIRMDISLTSKAIVYMENKPKEFFSDLTDLVSKFIP